MPPETSQIAVGRVVHSIIVLRGGKVILDSDLARIYGVPTKRLNEAVKRNIERFPSPLFMFRLTKREAEAVQHLRSQFVTLNDAANRSQFATTSADSRSQIATLKPGHNIKYLPQAFTEYGAIMAANVLNSPQAVKMSVFVVQAFVDVRKEIANYRKLGKGLAELERRLTGRFDAHAKAILQLIERLKRLENPPAPPRGKIGFVAEKRAVYRMKVKVGANGLNHA